LQTAEKTGVNVVRVEGLVLPAEASVLLVYNDDGAVGMDEEADKRPVEPSTEKLTPPLAPPATFEVVILVLLAYEICTQPPPPPPPRPMPAPPCAENNVGVPVTILADNLIPPPAPPPLELPFVEVVPWAIIVPLNVKVDVALRITKPPPAPPSPVPEGPFPPDEPIVLILETAQ
jgi:hypothetical protein